MSVDISDHALVRYIERVKGENLDKYREEIRALLSEHKGNRIPDHGYDDGVMFVLEQRRIARPIVVTVLTPACQPKRKAPWSKRSLIHVPSKFIMDPQP